MTNSNYTAKDLQKFRVDVYNKVKPFVLSKIISLTRYAVEMEENGNKLVKNDAGRVAATILASGRIDLSAMDFIGYNDFDEPILKIIAKDFPDYIINLTPDEMFSQREKIKNRIIHWTHKKNQMYDVVVRSKIRSAIPKDILDIQYNLGYTFRNTGSWISQHNDKMIPNIRDYKWMFDNHKSALWLLDIVMSFKVFKPPVNEKDTYKWLKSLYDAFGFSKASFSFLENLGPIERASWNSLLLSHFEKSIFDLNSEVEKKIFNMDQQLLESVSPSLSGDNKSFFLDLSLFDKKERINFKVSHKYIKQINKIIFENNVNYPDLMIKKIIQAQFKHPFYVPRGLGSVLYNALSCYEYKKVIPINSSDLDVLLSSKNVLSGNIDKDKDKDKIRIMENILKKWLDACKNSKMILSKSNLWLNHEIESEILHVWTPKQDRPTLPALELALKTALSLPIKNLPKHYNWEQICKFLNKIYVEKGFKKDSQSAIASNAFIVHNQKSFEAAHSYFISQQLERDIKKELKNQLHSQKSTAIHKKMHL